MQESVDELLLRDGSVSAVPSKREREVRLEVTARKPRARISPRRMFRRLERRNISTRLPRARLTGFDLPMIAVRVDAVFAVAVAAAGAALFCSNIATFTIS